MNWLHRCPDRERYNLLVWILPDPSPYFLLFVALVLTVVTIAIYIVSRAIRKPLRPRLISFEFARSSNTARNILDHWVVQGKLHQARKAILFDFLLLLPSVVALAAYLCFWAAMFVVEATWMARIGVVMAWAALAALLIGWAEGRALWVTIARGGGTKSVFLARLFARLKYAILAFAAAFLLCYIEYFFYENLVHRLAPDPGTFAVVGTFAVLFAVSAYVGSRVLQLAKPLHPSLLMLHLAPSSVKANRVLARWGEKRKIARKANNVDIAFAILYSETLAFLFFQLRPGNWLILKSLPRCACSSKIALGFGNWAWLSSLTWGVGWCMLLAGTFHVAQNVGAWAALLEGGMGWWIRICRSLGALRVLLLFFCGLWGGFLLLLWEAHLLSFVVCTNTIARACRCE
jgi:hypothetical protein